MDRYSLKESTFKRGGRGNNHKMNIMRDTVLYLISTGLNKGLPFLLLPLLTRYLTVDDFGYFGVAMVFVSVMTLFFGL